MKMTENVLTVTHDCTEITNPLWLQLNKDGPFVV